MNDLTTLQEANNQAADVATQAPPVMIPEKYVAAVFEPFKRKFAAAKRAAAKVEAYDITTTAGMNRAKELRASFRDIRTALENERKARKAPIIESGKLLDSRAAELKAEIEPLEDKYDAEIKAEEQRKEAEKQRKLAEERARIEAIENRIAHIRGAASRLASADSEAIKKEIEHWTLLRLDPADYQEFLEDALTAVNTTLDQLANLHAVATNREEEARRIAAERAELERLRAEQAERERVAAEERAERDRIAQAERDAAAAREAEMAAKMEEMRLQMEAMQRAMAPTPAALGDDPRTVGMGMESPVMLAPKSPVAAPVESPVAELPRAQLSLVDDIPAYEAQPKTQRPTDGEIIELLAITFEASEDTITRWLVDLVKGLEA